tara:strand:- start:61 stop:291 length:231 start_codon:yes stop_codon:yes gene_type:complete
MNNQEAIQDWNVRVSKRLQEAINESWEHANAILNGLREDIAMDVIDTDIVCVPDILDRASRIMSILGDYAQSKGEC